jgi:replicative DNA helicase
VPVSHKRNITPFNHFHRNIYKAVCLHLGLYCGVDVTMVDSEVNKFGQIFPIHKRRKYKDMG